MRRQGRMKVRIMSKRLHKSEIVAYAQGCARLFEEKKGIDVVLLNMMGIHSYFDYFLICTGNSLIHCRALAREAQKYFRNNGLHERMKSKLDSPWIVLDYNEIILHIFTEEMRAFYQLEKLWADAEKLKF